MVEELREIADRILNARVIAALTGAGVSKESGIPTFRDSDGLWSQYNLEQYATVEAIFTRPKEVWEWYRDRYNEVKAAEPNPGHRALAKLELFLRGNGKDFAVITQNIDGLHQRAGSENVIEIHGSLYRARCSACGKIYDMEEVVNGPLPPYCDCGGLIRPDVVMFGEPLPEKALDAAVRYAQQADVFMVIGTSAVVYPAASLPYIARDAGALLIEINLSDTPITSIADYVLRGKFGEVMPELTNAVIEKAGRE